MKDRELTYFRILAAAEGTSLLVLMLIAMPIKYKLGNPTPVRIVGGIHGGLFLMYLYMLFTVASDHGWPKGKWIPAVVAACVPFGTFWFDRRYLARSR